MQGELLVIKLWYGKSEFSKQEKQAKRLLGHTLLLETCSSRTSSSPPPLGRDGISLTSLFLTVLLLTVWLRQIQEESIKLKSPGYCLRFCSVVSVQPLPRVKHTVSVAAQKLKPTIYCVTSCEHGNKSLNIVSVGWVIVVLLYINHGCTAEHFTCIYHNTGRLMILLKEHLPKHFRKSVIHLPHEPQHNKENITERVREKARVKQK